jgi:hypothetical protein
MATQRNTMNNDNKLSHLEGIIFFIIFYITMVMFVPILSAVVFSMRGKNVAEIFLLFEKMCWVVILFYIAIFYHNTIITLVRKLFYFLKRKISVNQL